MSIGNWAMARALYVSVGGLDQRLEGWGGENIDLSLKVCGLVLSNTYWVECFGVMFAHIHTT